jgi:hypothetical protein
MPEIMACQQLLICPYFNVQFFGYLTSEVDIITDYAKLTPAICDPGVSQ